MCPSESDDDDDDNVWTGNNVDDHFNTLSSFKGLIYLRSNTSLNLNVQLDSVSPTEQ